MLVPTHQRMDRTLPVITVGLDGINTTQRKKFKCSICGGTVFAYYDSLRFLMPINVADGPDHEFFEAMKTPPTEVECTHNIIDEHGRRTRCRTVYVIFRG